jgi:hypothetical protein
LSEAKQLFRSAFFSCGFGSFFAEGYARLLRQMRDGPFSPRSPGGPFDISLRCGALFPGRHGSRQTFFARLSKKRECPTQRFFVFLVGLPLRLVFAILRSSALLIDLYMPLDAPLREDFLRSPLLAANAAPAAICCFFDFAGIQFPSVIFRSPSGVLFNLQKGFSS